jgi:rhomboid protease GluP
MMTKLTFKLPAEKVFLVLVLANIAVYVVQLFYGVNGIEPALPDLIKWGADVAPLTLLGEPWRLFTSMFLHIGFLHLALNMYMLILCGRFVERAYGSFNFSIIYFISGLFGSLSSALWHASHKVQHINIVFSQSFVTEQLQLIVSVGASGALMGITGAYLARWLVNELTFRDQPDHSNIVKAFAITIGLNITMGLMTPGVDNACHLGGAVSGAIVGGLLSITPQTAGFAKRFSLGLAISFLSLVLLYKGTQMPVSDELKTLKTQVLTELQDMQKDNAH